eukprot:767253-Hanusia_phi.AAC.1
MGGNGVEKEVVVLEVMTGARQANRSSELIQLVKKMLQVMRRRFISCDDTGTNSRRSPTGAQQGTFLNRACSDTRRRGSRSAWTPPPPPPPRPPLPSLSPYDTFRQKVESMTAGLQTLGLTRAGGTDLLLLLLLRPLLASLLLPSLPYSQPVDD